MGSLHSKLIDMCVSNGWNKSLFKKKIYKILKKEPWCDEAYNDILEESEEGCENYEPCDSDVIAAIKGLRVVPDCWRVSVEKWNWDVLVIEFMEVCIENDISEGKMIKYENFWWAMDASSNFSFRLYRMNRDETVSVVIGDYPEKILDNNVKAIFVED